MKHPQILRFPSLVLGTSLFIASCLATHAAILVEERFDYVAGSIADLNGGIGWGGAWGVGGGGTSMVSNVAFPAASAALPAGYTAPVEPNLLALLPVGNTQSASRNLASSINLNPASTQTIYFSFVFARVDSANNGGTEGVYFQMRDGNTLLLEFGFNSSEQLTLNATGAGGSSISTPSAAISFTGNTATTSRYVVAGKMVLNPAGGNDSFYLSVFGSDANLASEPVSWDLSLTGVNASGAINNINLITQFQAEKTYWDNLVIGTTFTDVVTIPEASTTSLILSAMAVSGLCLRRFRAASANS